MKGDADKYKLNSLTEFLFTKHGFNALFQDADFPQDLLSNPCLGVVVDVVEDSKLFTTRLKFELRDCYNKIVYTSIEGMTREKEYVKAFQEALRAAFVSFEAMDYEFNPALVTNLSVTSKTTEPTSSVTAKPESSSKTEPGTVTLPEPVSVVVVEEGKASEQSAVTSAEASKVDEMDSKQTVPVSEVQPTPVPVPLNAENQVVSENSEQTNRNLKSYKNENISFFIIDQGDKLLAYVNETKFENYKKGDLIGTLVKTSIPNVYRVTWKDKEGKNKETTGYFDDAGNLKIDVNINGAIEVIIFELEQ